MFHGCTVTLLKTKRAALLWPLTSGKCSILTCTNSSQGRDAVFFFPSSFFSRRPYLSSRSFKRSWKHQLSWKTDSSYSNCSPDGGTIYAITVFQHHNISTTPPWHTQTWIYRFDCHKLTVRTLIFSRKMPLQIENIKGEQCILYKYFKSIELSLIYVCVHKMLEWWKCDVFFPPE